LPNIQICCINSINQCIDAIEGSFNRLSLPPSFSFNRLSLPPSSKDLKGISLTFTNKAAWSMEQDSVKDPCAAKLAVSEKRKQRRGSVADHNHDNPKISCTEDTTPADLSTSGEGEGKRKRKRKKKHRSGACKNRGNSKKLDTAVGPTSVDTNLESAVDAAADPAILPDGSAIPVQPMSILAQSWGASKEPEGAPAQPGADHSCAEEARPIDQSISGVYCAAGPLPHSMSTARCPSTPECPSTPLRESTRLGIPNTPPFNTYLVNESMCWPEIWRQMWRHDWWVEHILPGGHHYFLYIKPGRPHQDGGVDGVDYEIGNPHCPLPFRSIECGEQGVDYFVSKKPLHLASESFATTSKEPLFEYVRSKLPRKSENQSMLP
jgi:hypothetical protein